MTRSVWLPLCLLLVCGCGSGAKLAPVTGKVTFKGEPVTNASVTFSPTTEGKAAGGILNDKGEFTLTTTNDNDGAMLGKHRVVVSSHAEKAAWETPKDLVLEVKASGNDFHIELHPAWKTKS